MRVCLIEFTPNPETVVAAAGYTCHSKKCIAPETLDDKKIKKILKFLNVSGHHSVLEHASFTFAVDGLSRACSHQLVRHRVASYSQQSQRYVDLSDAGYVVPKTILRNKKTKRIFESEISNIWEAYKKLTGNKIPDEDARYILPNATKTSIVITMNARELTHFFSLRCCVRAQWEIRELANKMLKEVKKVSPLLFENAGPACKQLGYCPEIESCGLVPRKEEFIGMRK